MLRGIISMSGMIVLTSSETAFQSQEKRTRKISIGIYLLNFKVCSWAQSKVMFIASRMTENI